MAITDLSMAARAEAVTDRSEAEKVLRMLPLKYPEQAAPLPFPMPTPDDIRIFRVTPTVISVLDCSMAFGHTDLVTCREGSARQGQHDAEVPTAIPLAEAR